MKMSQKKSVVTLWWPWVIGAVSLSIFWFNNCGKVFEVRNRQRVSSSCNESKLLTASELDLLISEGHQPMQKGERLRCPGFFAVLEDDQASTLAHQKAQLASDDCNQNGIPNEPDIPPPDKTKDQLIRDLIAQTKGENIRTWVEAMSDNSMWPTRFHESTFNNKVAEWIQGEFKKLAGSRADVKINLVTHQNTPQKSVEVLIEGKGPHKEKFVVLGGHQDSIELTNSRNNPDSRSPGADDNASGVAALLEAFRVLMSNNYSPDASLAIYTYAAEEIGLVGSQEIARSYANSSKEVLGVMQIDMAMYSTQSDQTLYLISDYTSTSMNQLAVTLLNDYLGLKAKFLACGYACSDHASWTKYNYPSFMPAEYEVEDSVSRIHTVRDLADQSMDEDYAAQFSKLAIAFAIYLAGQ